MRERQVRVHRSLLLTVMALLGVGLAFAVNGEGRPADHVGLGWDDDGSNLIALGDMADRFGWSGGASDELIVWTSGGLPDGFADRIAELDGVRRHSVTRGDRVDLTGAWDADGSPLEQLDAGWVIPLEGFAVEPGDLVGFLPRDVRRAVSRLGDGRALLSETSAAVRGAGVGAELEFGDERVEVVGIVPDRWVGAAEVVVDLPTGERIGIERERFALIARRGDVGELVGAIERLLQGQAARIGPVEELEHIRQGSGVLPQSHVKERFGEFALRDLGRRGFEQDPAWVEENIRTERVPLLGRITCHRDFFPAIRGALQELEDRGLGHLVSVRDYGGCWTPRFSGARRSISRHAWGITADFNISRNPYGADPNQDPRLVEVMEGWGMDWGGRWLVPDGMHFEHVEWP